MLRNLLHNAEQHARSLIEVDIITDGTFARIRVSDDGPGIPLELREHAFERFVRLDEARNRAEGGSGLGLAIVADVVSQHNGTVAIGDAALGGAEFVIDIPMTDPES